MTRSILALGLCLLSAACSPMSGKTAVIAERTRDARATYRRVIGIENSLPAMTAGWERDRKQQVGRDPQATLETEMSQLQQDVDYLLVARSPSGVPDDWERKKVFMELVKEEGLSSSLYKTGLFSMEELEALGKSGKYGATEEFKVRYGQEGGG